ncbi:MAG TPA: phytanoyl-CoA dioxygenase family protein [Vicinamibacterales bacterium]|nr:phytanoyl-CoA dioxygenase family protein [Vicinamibacterales bacterium]
MSAPRVENGAQDLSLHHEMLTTLFANPAGAESWRRFRLTADQIEAFHERGYLAPIPVLDDVQVEALRTELADLMDPAHPKHALFYEFHSNESKDQSTVLFHALGAWRIAPAFHDLLWSRAVVIPAAQLLGGAVRFWHDQLFCKPPRHGGVVAWHQDYSYWTRTVPMAHLTCWIALDDATRENGCLQYIPGSHLWNLLPRTELAGDMESIASVLTEHQRERFTPVPIEVPRGYASFHHPLIVHGSSANTSVQPRRGTVVNVIRDGVRSATDSPLLDGVPAIPAGTPLGGQFFPLLFDPEPSFAARLTRHEFGAS